MKLSAALLWKECNILRLGINDRYADLIRLDDIIKDIFAVSYDGISKRGIFAKQFIVCILKIRGRHIDTGMKRHLFLLAVKSHAKIGKLIPLAEAQLVQPVYIRAFVRTVRADWAK